MYIKIYKVANKPCLTIDVCFNPGAVMDCTTSPKILEAIVMTAIENAEVRVRQTHPTTTLSKSK